MVAHGREIYTYCLIARVLETISTAKCRVKLHFHVEQEHDQLVYTYYDKNIVLKPGVPRIVAEADDSQCRTTITATDSRTNLIMFRYTTDQAALPTDCDIDLSFRTVYSDYGSRFHDRYLILKYKINKTRVWSLGTSVNSIGKSHHIIQIVEAPTLIESFFDKVWHETDFQVCKIYESTDYK